MLAQALEKRGIEIVLTREPGGTPGAEAIRSLLLDPGGEAWTPEAEALLFAAARSDHVARLIWPALKSGRWVICDRFIDSSRAYQGGAGGLGDETILTLHRIGSGALLPDRTLLIGLPAEQAEGRLAARDRGASDRIGGRSREYHRQVGEFFRRCKEAEPHRFALIDGEGSADEVHRRVMAALLPLFECAA